MNSKRPLAPPFINQLDDYLLTRHPDTWSARAHLVLYYGFLAYLVLTGLFFVIPLDITASTDVPVWTTLMVLIALVAFIFWLIFLLRFNVFKRFGNIRTGDGIKTFALFFISISVFTWLPFLPWKVETLRANMAIGNDELVRDINDINLKVCQLERDSLPLEFQSQTFYLYTGNDSGRTYFRGETVVDEPARNGEPQIRNYIDTADLRMRIERADSVVKVNDTTYTIYESPDYRFITNYYADNYSGIRQLTNKEIFNRVLKTDTRPDKQKVYKELRQLLKKYGADEHTGYALQAPDGYYQTYPNRNFMERIQSKYNLSGADNGIDNVASKKYSYERYGKDSVWRVYFYTTLFLTLMIFIFRHSTVRTYFLTMLAAVILTILTTLFVVAGRASESAFLIIMLFYYLIFAGLAFGIFTTRSRHLAGGIALNLFTFLTPVMPLIAAAAYYQIARDNLDGSILYQQEFIALSERMRIIFPLSELAGFVLLLVLIEPVFRKLYRAWFARPEE